MKILMINVVCGIRSTGRICTDLAVALEAEGNEVRIAYGREEVPEKFQKYAVRIGNDMNVKLHGVRARFLDGCGFGSKNATHRFIEWVKDYDPDVIHLHNLHGYYINIEALFNYLRTCGKKIIWTLHDGWAYTGHSAFCDAIGCEMWKTGCHNCPLQKEYPASFTDRSRNNWEKKKSIMTGIHNMTLVTPSNWLAETTRESFLKEYPVVVINNGIDTSSFYPLESDFKELYGITGKKMLLGVATAWNELKGWSDYMKLADMLDDSYQIVMVGLSKKQVSKLPEKIIGIERTNNITDLAKIYSAADVLLNLSYCESFGMTNIESRLCGTPVITYSSGGWTETAGADGIVVEKGNLKGIIKALNNNNLTNKKIKDIDDTGIRNAYDTENMLSAYKACYASDNRGAF